MGGWIWPRCWNDNNFYMVGWDKSYFYNQQQHTYNHDDDPDHEYNHEYGATRPAGLASGSGSDKTRAGKRQRHDDETSSDSDETTAGKRHRHDETGSWWSPWCPRQDRQQDSCYLAHTSHVMRR